MKNLIYSFVLLFVTTSIFAQSEREIELERGKAAIQDLKNGALIVRLPSNQKKLAALQETLNGKYTSESSKARLQSMVKETEEKTWQNARLFAASLKKEYSFSKYYLMWDYSLDSLKSGIKKGYFLNNDLEKDSNIELTEDKFLTLRHGHSKNQGLESFIVTDQNLQDLDRPFPYYFRLNTFKYFFNSLFFAKTAKEKQMETLGYEVHERLERFYLDKISPNL